MDDVRNEGTDIATILMSEADKLPQELIDDEEDIRIPEYMKDRRDPVDIMLDEMREQTQVLKSINKQLVYVVTFLAMLATLTTAVAVFLSLLVNQGW
tara:strand:+ start:34267 stop:34557 length:291 start_codon:yes stop_codon:yes gene_type:complete